MKTFDFECDRQMFHPINFHFPNMFCGLKSSGFTSVWSVSHADKHRLRLRHFSFPKNKEIDFDLHLYCVPTVYQPLKALSSTCHIHPCTLRSQSLVGETSGGLLNRSRHHSPPQSHDQCLHREFQVHPDIPSLV